MRLVADTGPRGSRAHLSVVRPSSMASGDAPRRHLTTGGSGWPGRRVGALSTSPIVMLRIPAALGHAFRRDLGAGSGGTATVRLDLLDASRRKAADSGGRSSEGAFGAGCWAT